MSIHFYRILKLFYGITIDLDDTLYENNSIIQNAELKSVSFLKNYHPALQKINQKNYNFSRKILSLTDPNICYNVNHWRWKAINITLLKAGLNKYDAQRGADYAMDIIIYWRNKINISPNTHKILSDLSLKWPLIAITNGNADPSCFGLKKYFYDVLYAGKNGRPKPFIDMYAIASKRFNIPYKYILHIGNDLKTDIQGSACAGMQNCWTFEYTKSDLLNKEKNKIYFPNFKISQLKLLKLLLKNKF